MPVRLAACLLLLASAPASAQSAASAAQAEGRFVRALTAVAIEDFETAQRSLDEVLEGAPDDATVLALRAQVAVALDAPADAVFFARRATEVAGDRAETWLTLAEALQAAGQSDAAADALGRARALAPSDPDVLTATADLAAERGDAEAERDALAALVRLGDTVAARLRLSRLAETPATSTTRSPRRRPPPASRPPRPPSLDACRTSTRHRRPALRRERRAAAVPAGGADAADALLDQIDANPRQVDGRAHAPSSARPSQRRTGRRHRRRRAPAVRLRSLCAGRRG